MLNFEEKEEHTNTDPLDYDDCISNQSVNLELSDKKAHPEYWKGLLCWILCSGICIGVITIVSIYGLIANEILGWIMAVYLMTFYFIPNFTTGVVKTRIRRKEELKMLAKDDNDNDEMELQEQQYFLRSSEELPRLFFLDNLKIVLTFITVSHNVSCSLGGCGRNSWPIIIGLREENNPNLFSSTISYFALLDQAYVAPLFFFISAYFVASSYKRKEKWEFHYDICRRLLLPCILVTVFIYPASTILAQATRGTNLIYTPELGPSWFLLWLTLFSIIYSILVDHTLTLQMKKMPGTMKRFIYGAGICGGVVIGVSIIMEPIEHFLFIPVNSASFVSSLCFFILGIVASRNNWLQTPIRDHLDISVWLLRIFVFVEAMSIYVLWFLSLEHYRLRIIGKVLCGLFSVDISLALFEIFQTYFNWQTRVSKRLAESAYGVFLLHPLVIVLLNAVTIFFYRFRKYGEGIEFDGITPNSYSTIAGPEEGALVLLGWWLVLNFLSHTILWPLAHGLKQVPILREFL